MNILFVILMHINIYVMYQYRYLFDYNTFHINKLKNNKLTYKRSDDPLIDTIYLDIIHL